MLKRSIYFLYFLAAIFFFAACNNNNAIETITENDLKIHMEFLASDALQGREAGEPGSQVAAQYLVSELKQLGLNPIDSNGNFLQQLDSIEFLSITGKNSLEINPKDGNNNLIIGDVFLNLNYSKKHIAINGPLCFAGYGFSDSLKKYNDFENINIKNKVVMILTGTPFSDNHDFSPNKLELEKINYLQKNKVKAVLWVFDHASSNNNFYSFRNKIKDLSKSLDSGYDSLDIFFITKSTANLILNLADTDLSYIQKKISNNFAPYSFEFSDLSIKIDIGRKKELPIMENVIGYIEGSNPELKKECIIYTAHYDHIGIDSDGAIYNGADDNASGCAALLEIADAFMSMKEKPKRSIIFAWMAAEEKGLLGSSFYAKHPVFPIEQTVACINLDMIGRVKKKEDTFKNPKHNLKSSDSILVVSGLKNAELVKINIKNLNKLNLFADYNNKKLMKNSDHYPFYEKGVPVLFYTTGLHPEYHTTDDEIQKISLDKIKKIARLAYMVGLETANSQDIISD